MDMDTENSPIIAINGTEELLQVVIGNEVSGVLFQAGINGPGRTMRFLLPLIDEGLTRLNIPLAHCRGMACTRGPGSFTGIRVVAATLQGMARGATLPLAGLDYLPLLARDLAAHWQGEAWMMTYARKNQVYIQGFSMPETTPLAAATACSHEQAADMLTSRKARILVAGSGLVKNKDFFTNNLPDSLILATHRHTLAPETLLKAGLNALFSHASITPLYIRPSDAEENLPAIAHKRGIPLKQALLRVPRQK